MGVPSVIEVFDIRGRRVFKSAYSVLPFGTNTIDIDLRKLRSGTYYIRYRDVGGVLSTAIRRISILR